MFPADRDVESVGLFNTLLNRHGVRCTPTVHLNIPHGICHILAGSGRGEREYLRVLLERDPDLDLLRRDLGDLLDLLERDFDRAIFNINLFFFNRIITQTNPHNIPLNLNFPHRVGK